ncbi:MAG TPA: trehalase family glycosidase [Balneolales bacterium]|nr:trehalase family glycosidase [Balneolales bacterium]
MKRRNFIKATSLLISAPFLKHNRSLLTDEISSVNEENQELFDKIPQPVIPGRPDLVKMYNKCWLLGSKNTEHGTPQNGFVKWYIDAAFDNRIFQWDTCFCLDWAKYSQGVLPNIQSLDNFYRKQHPDGAIGGVIHKSDGTDNKPQTSPSYTHNNLFSWAEYEYYKVTGDSSRFSRVIPVLDKYDDWVTKNRTHPNGHYWWSGFGSGMDNSPRSKATKSYPPYGWVDYDANEALAAYYLIKMADVAGNNGIIRKYRKRFNHIKHLVNKDMWSSKDSFYWDIDKDGSFMKVKTIASFWPMWGRITDDNQLNLLIDHLNDTRSFNRSHRIPTDAADQKSYVPTGGYWRGSVWAPTNHMVVKGLETHGKYQLARDIVQNHLNNISAIFSGTNTVWENYAPEFDKPGQPAKNDFVGWSALGPITQLIEIYIGLHLDVPGNKIRWNLLTTEKVGIKNLKFGDQYIGLVAEARKHVGDPIHINSKLSKEITLELFDGSRNFKRKIRLGSQTLVLGKKS